MLAGLHGPVHEQGGSCTVSSTIRIAVGGSLGECLQHLPPPNTESGITILPSSLRRNDLAVNELREHLRQQGHATHLRLPAPALPSLFGRKSDAWTQVTLPHPAESPGRSIALPTNLVQANDVWSVVDIDAISGRGPYVLDLPARFTDTPTRVRLLGSSRRAELAIAIFQTRPIHRHLIVRHFASFEFVATTTDPIAAELLALSLVDEDLTRDHQVAGPWEDDLVQRATERELGVRLPDEITVEVVGKRGPDIEATLSRVLGRIGIHHHHHTKTA